MQFLAALASLGLSSTIAASPVTPLEDRAAPAPIHLQIKSQQGSQKFNGDFLTFAKHGGQSFVLVPNSDPKPADATKFTLSDGALHIKVPPNMVIASGEYSTNAITFGDFIFFDKGKGSNDFLTINKTDGRLTFKATQSGTPGETNFRLCPLVNGGGGLKGLSLGNHGDGTGCEAVFVQTSKA